MPLSYLVSTAGHAQSQNDRCPHDIRSIIQLIEQGADELGDEKVVGFVSLSEADQWVCDRYSFPELLSLSAQLAKGLAGVDVGVQQTSGLVVSLLCPTGLDFLLAWIALMKMGFGVVLIAPQCSPSAINGLLQQTSSTLLIFHPKYRDLATSVGELDSSATITELPSRPAVVVHVSESTDAEAVSLSSDAISHLFHTSGTSGTPKPIPHTHLRSVTALPRRAVPTYLAKRSTSSAATEPTAEAAAFTTTPLFHGGISDLLRAWMARSVVYFYPTSDMPITSANVVAAVNACQDPPPVLPGMSMTDQQVLERMERFRVRAFLSVPYILIVLAEDTDGPGLAMLKTMDFVSTGGAPLDSGVGDRMVKRGVRLVSRLGSSECGFLLSSHRDYETEVDWEWLRNDSPYADALVFEPVGALVNRFEMVVTSRWSSKTKSNRDDESYATGDLYEPHPTKRHVWRYVGRGDDVVVMSDGEKASPGPIEMLLRSSPLLSDALVVGADRPEFGVLLFPRSLPAPTDLVAQLSPLIAQANQSSPSFAQVAEEMCLVVTDAQKAACLPKSSKGTIQRGLAYDVFQAEIERVYDEGSSEGTEAPRRALPEIEKLVMSLIKTIARTGRRAGPLDRTADLFSWGVNSLMAIRVRSAMLKQLNTGGNPLPANIVFEHPTIAQLATYIHDLQEGRVGTLQDDHLSGDGLMRSLVTRYGAFDAPPNRDRSRRRKERGSTVVVTGATGSLGSFLLEQLSNLPSDIVEKVVCLVRADNDLKGRLRVEKVVDRRGAELRGDTVTVYSAELSAPQLGLTGEVYAELAEKAAWPVHFDSSLVSFESSIKGTRNLLDLLAAASPASRLYFCSSLASVLAKPPPDGRILEAPSVDPSTASPIGYSQSKWVTEAICRSASESVVLHGRVHVLRIGQLCGDTMTGHWNEKEGWPLLIRTSQTTGCLPLLNETPSWLPVDLAAQTIVDIVLGDNSTSFIHHIVHPLGINWSTVLDGLKSATLRFERVRPSVWLQKVEASPEEDPSKQMLPLWKSAYESEADAQPKLIVDTTNATLASVSFRKLKPNGEEHIRKMVHAWRQTGFLEQPTATR